LSSFDLTLLKCDLHDLRNMNEACATMPLRYRHHTHALTGDFDNLVEPWMTAGVGQVQLDRVKSWCMRKLVNSDSANAE
jgi:hypothetical protein